MKRLIVRIRRKLRFYIFKLVCLVIECTHALDEQKICFLSDNREVMGGNLKSIYDALEGSSYQRVIEFKRDRRVRRTLKEKLSLAYNLSTSRYILLEDLSTAITYFPVRKHQDIVQLWHGPGAYKRFGYSRKKTGEKIGTIHRGYKKYTKVITSGEKIRWCYAEAFGLPLDKVKATGFPRTDDFYHQDYLDHVRETFYQNYPELKDKKIILFAPTYRGVVPRDASYDFSKLDLDALYEKFHQDYVIIFKWHPALYNNIVMKKVKAPNFEKYHGFYRDFSFYRDIQELLVVCDTLVTDYSSLIFDYVLLNKPIVYYTYDLEDYTGYNGRGLYFPFETYVYGEVAHNMSELIAALSKGNLESKKRKVFFETFMNACDGKATKRAVQYILRG